MGWVYNASAAVNAQSNYPTILGVSISLVVLMAIVVCLRFYLRGLVLNVVGADDWVIGAGAVCSITYNVLTIIQSRWGLGLPLADRPLVNLNTYSTVNYAGRPFYMMGILSFKVALCLGYLRILSIGQSGYRLIVHITLATCIVFHLAGTLILILNCRPVKRSWRPLTPGSCLPFGPTNYGLASTTIMFDVVIFLLPIPFLHSLQMNKRKKYGIIGVFLLGLFTTVCSIMRLTQISVIATGNGNSTMLVLWGNIEMNIGIILTCIPVLAPLFKFFTQKLSSNGYGSNGYPPNGYASKTDRLRQSQGYRQSQAHRLQVLSQSGNTANIVSKSSKARRDTTGNDSQETILGLGVRDSDDRIQRGGEILKTVQVQVQSTSREGNQERSSKHFV